MGTEPYRGLGTWVSWSQEEDQLFFLLNLNVTILHTYTMTFVHPVLDVPGGAMQSSPRVPHTMPD